MKRFILVAAIVMLAMPGLSGATLIYDTWVSNDGVSGNYIVTVDQVGDVFQVEVTVDPWNAEALGIFIDWGDFDLTNTSITNVSPSGEVSLFATDTSSSSCGSGCNLNGLDAPIAAPDGEWEWVIRLGSSGFNGIQTFSFDLAANGLSEADWGLIGIRAQQLCDPGQLLPDGACDGSDKSYSGTKKVPEPGTLALVGAGLLGMGLRRRMSRKA